MGVEVAIRERERTESPLSSSRIFVALAILTAEVGFLTTRVPPALWRAWAENATDELVGSLTLMALCGAGSIAVTMLLWVERLLALLNQPSTRPRSRPYVVFAAQAVAFALVYVAVGRLVDGEAGAASIAAAAAGAAAMLSLLLLALLPGSTWMSILKVAAVPGLVGVAIGYVTFDLSAGSFQNWQFLIDATLVLVKFFLGLFTDDVRFVPEIPSIGTATFTIEILAPCSGYEGIGLVWAFLATYFWFLRRELRFPHALLLVPIGTLVIWVVNALRLALLIGVGTLWSPAVALGGFHSTIGSVTFTAVGFALIFVTHRLAFFRKDAPAFSAGPNPAAPYLVPFMALIGLRMIGGALVADFDYLYPIRVVGVGLAVWWYWNVPRKGDWTWSWMPIGIGSLAYVLWIAFDSALANNSPATRSAPFALSNLAAPWAAVWVAFRTIGSIVAVPIAEELAFRGFLLRRIDAVDFRSVPPGRFSLRALLVSSALFGLLHGRWMAATLAGALYAGALYRRGHIGDAIVAHAVTNALIAVHVLFGERWDLWL